MSCWILKHRVLISAGYALTPKCRAGVPREHIEKRLSRGNRAGEQCHYLADNMWSLTGVLPLLFNKNPFWKYFCRQDPNGKKRRRLTVYIENGLRYRPLVGSTEMGAGTRYLSHFSRKRKPGFGAPSSSSLVTDKYGMRLNLFCPTDRCMKEFGWNEKVYFSKKN